MGCQWKGMARQMMEFDVFARSMRQSHEVLTKFGVDLIDFVTSNKGAHHSMALVQASIVAVQVALVDTLGAVGIQPDGMVGHSVGEIGCAYSDGCLTAEQAVLCAYWRGRCIDMGNLPDGAMAAVGLTWQETVQRCRDDIVPACHNAKDSVTVSGTKLAVAKFVEELKAEDVFVREVDSANVAFHSQHMQVIAPAFRNAVQEVVPDPRPRSKRWVSSCFPENRWLEPGAQCCSVDYLVQNLVAPVLFYEAVQHVPKDAIIVEIGPHCLLQAILRRTLSSTASCMGLMKREEDNVTFLLKSLGKLHTLGMQLNLSPLYPSVSFPVPRGTPSIGHLVSWDHSQNWAVAKWNQFSGSRQISEDIVEINLDSNEEDEYLVGHQLAGRIVFPGAGYMVMAWKSLAKRCGKPFLQVPVMFEDVTFHRATILPRNGSVRFQMNIMPASGEFEVSEGGSLAASGRIRVAEEKDLQEDSAAMPAETSEYELDNEDIYKATRIVGYEYSGDFRGILKADLHKMCGKLTWTDNWVTFLDSMFQLSIFLRQMRTFQLPTRVQSCLINPRNQPLADQDAGSGGVHAVYDSCLNTCRAGGVVIQALKSTTATSRSDRQIPCLEKYQFVPYIDDEAAKQELEASLQEYVGVCGATARRIIEAGREEATKVSGLVMDSSEASPEIFDRHVKGMPEKKGLLSALSTVESKVKAEGSSLTSAVKYVCTTLKKDLDGDILNTALLEESFLRPLLDVVLENTSRNRIHVLELASGESSLLLTPRVSELLPLSGIMIRAEYALAHPRPDEVTTEILSGHVVRYPWNPSSTTVNDLPQAQLLVTCIVPSSSNHLETLALQMSTLCKENAFVLLCMRTAFTSAEALFIDAR
uniref:Putative animal-type fatty acid synthase n=1 Tax=Amblyomma triste TaxID=251400 RepID=A0A023GNU9_AMBTT